MQNHECKDASALIEIKWRIWDEIVKVRKLCDEADTELAAIDYHLVAGGLTDALNIVRDYIADPALAGLA